MRARGVDPGVPLDPAGGCGAPRRRCRRRSADHVLLVAVTEVNPPEALDRYVAAAREVLALRAASAISRGPR